MASKINKDVKNNPTLLHLLVNDKKTTSSSTIILDSSESSNAHFLKGQIDVSLKNSTYKLKLLVHHHCYKKGYYALQYRCIEFTEVPFFRLDLEGPSHRNGSKKLKECKIDTPHINTFDDNGRPHAFRYKEMESKSFIEKLSLDVNEGIQFFCKKTNVQRYNGIFPVIQRRVFALDLDQDLDPNSVIKIN